MFHVAFRDGSDGQLVWGARPEYNNEYLQDYHKELTFAARIGESLMNFASLTGDIAASNHPFILLAGEYAEGISENSFFLVHLREYLDLLIENPKYSSLDCFMFFLDLMGLSIPACHYRMLRKKEHENDCVEESIPYEEKMSSFERSLRGFLKVGESIYDVPLTVYDCDSIEDACCASLHFLITHNFKATPHRKKCKIALFVI